MWYEPFVKYKTIDVAQDSYTEGKNKRTFNRRVAVCNLKTSATINETFSDFPRKCWDI